MLNTEYLTKYFGNISLKNSEIQYSRVKNAPGTYRRRDRSHNTYI